MIVVVGSVTLHAEPSGTGRAAGLAAEIAAAAAVAGSGVELVARIGDDGAGEELLLALGRARVGHLAVLRDPAHATALAPQAPGDGDGEGDGRGEPDVGEERDGDGVETIPALLAEAEAAARWPRAGRAEPVVATPAGAAAPAPVGPALDAADLALGLDYLRDFRVVVAVEPLAAGGARVVADAAAFAGAALVLVAVPGGLTPAGLEGATIVEAPPDDPDGAFARLVGRYAAALDGGVAAADAFRVAITEDGWERALP